ncbi:MFS transporter [Telmatospirillum siberiense]|uniref:MFS transporter n=1 Tax=Telmatospirillum siberiense TaxID=382514 RepID=A0A2N3PWF5_9PROT|nr:MFS transporter [Telmatospirillum siberiense]PKU24727.1 MFS transporter [Telmatospirillum siberiense]
MRSETISAASQAASSARPTRARFVILALLAVGTMINYLDRTVLGIAAPSLTKDLGLTATVMGIVFSAFSWTYAAAQIPGGVFLDRYGSKLTYTLALGFWSLFTGLQGFATGLYSLLFYRFGLGVAESPCFPTNSRIVGTWFPQQERARATSIYTVGEYIGLAAFGPGLFWIMANYGWHSLFLVVGVVGVLYSLAFWWGYTEPQDCKTVNQAELDYIAAGDGLVPKSAQKVPFTWENCKKLLKFRQIWGAGIGQYAGNTALVFFLTWFPTYLATERHMGWVKMGFFAVLPFLAAAIGIMVGGWASDQLLKKTGSANIARKGPIIFGLLLASTIVTANYVESDNAVIAILSLAFFGQGMVGLGWTLISDMAPKHLMGLTGGFFNLAANLAGIVTPIVIGVILSVTGSFVGALAFVGAVALIGACSYIFLLGDVKRLEID